MDTKIGLAAGQQFRMSFATRGVAEGGLLQFAWLYVTGEAGGATVQVTDTDGIPQPIFEVAVPGGFASVLRQSQAPRVTEAVVTAGNVGFRGEIHIDLLHLRP